MAFIKNPAIDQHLRNGDVESALRDGMAAPGSVVPGLNRLLSRQVGQPHILAEDAAYAGLTFGDFLYDFVRIDPEIVRGIEFARAGDVDSMLSFAHFAETKAELTGASLQGLHSELQGYVAEQLAAHHLIAQGHDVRFPDTPNNPGWDFEVDGHPFQVKCLGSPQGVLEHFQHYPDIPVITNTELADQVGDHPGVYIDPELHHDSVQHLTAHTLEQGRELADFEIPWISLAVSAGSNLYYFVQAETDLIGFLTCTATDTVGRAGGGVIGKYAGSLAGLAFLGPAGAIVLGAGGAIVGAGQGRRAIRHLRRVLVVDQEAAVHKRIVAVADAASASMPAKHKAWQSKADSIIESLSSGNTNRSKLREYLLKRIREQMAHWKGKESELARIARETEPAEPVSATDRLLTIVRRAGIHPHVVQEPMRALLDELKNYIDACKRFRVAKA